MSGEVIVVTEGDRDVVVVPAAQREVVEVVEEGPRGPIGLGGPAGPTGPPGPTDIDMQDLATLFENGLI